MLGGQRCHFQCNELDGTKEKEGKVKNTTVQNEQDVEGVLFLCSFLNSCGCSTAKSMTPPQETYFSPT